MSCVPAQDATEPPPPPQLLLQPPPSLQGLMSLSPARPLPSFEQKRPLPSRWVLSPSLQTRPELSSFASLRSAPHHTHNHSVGKTKPGRTQHDAATSQFHVMGLSSAPLCLPSPPYRPLQAPASKPGHTLSWTCLHRCPACMRTCFLHAVAATGRPYIRDATHPHTPCHTQHEGGAIQRASVSGRLFPSLVRASLDQPESLPPIGNKRRHTNGSNATTLETMSHPSCLLASPGPPPLSLPLQVSSSNPTGLLIHPILHRSTPVRSRSETCPLCYPFLSLSVPLPRSLKATRHWFRPLHLHEDQTGEGKKTHTPTHTTTRHHTHASHAVTTPKPRRAEPTERSWGRFRCGLLHLRIPNQEKAQCLPVFALLPWVCCT